MKRLHAMVLVFGLVSLFGGFAWIRASEIKINWIRDVDVHQTAYHRECDPIVQRYFHGRERARLPAHDYLTMLDELKSCNRTTQTPIAQR